VKFFKVFFAATMVALILPLRAQDIPATESPKAAPVADASTAGTPAQATSLSPQLPPATVPASQKLRICVLDFPVAKGAWEGWGVSGWANQNAQISSSLQEIMTTELINQAKGKYALIERERLESVLAEQKLGAGGLVDEETAVQMGKLLGVRYMITGKVTRFAYKKSGYSSGWLGTMAASIIPGVGLVASGAAMAAGSINVQKVSFAGRLDIRIIDVQTGEILAAVSEDGKVADYGVKVAGAGNEVQYDGELVNKLFEPIAQKLAEKVSGKLAKI